MRDRVATRNTLSSERRPVSNLGYLSVVGLNMNRGLIYVLAGIAAVNQFANESHVNKKPIRCRDDRAFI